MNRSRFLWGGITAVALLGVTAFFAWSRHFSDPANDDTSAIPRQGKNAPFIVSDDAVVAKMIEVAEISEDDLVYDLGCGDGRIVIGAAEVTGCRGVGFDIDPERVAEATENAKLREVDDRVEIKLQDVFTVDLSDADVVMMYLLPWMQKQLIPQIDQMRPGTKLVTHDFRIPGCKPDRVIDVPLENERHYVNFYVLPLKKGSAPE